MSVVLPKYLEEMLKGLPNPKSVWKYMLAVTQIPRGSNDEGENFRHKKILSFLKDQAEALHCETYVDKGENLIIRKAAYPGLETKPTVCLQCHMDMVVQKDDDVQINFDTDPLVPRVVDGYLRATGTSLGADNGIGIAACFAILEDNSIKHGPLEVLVTRDEETGMYGATDLEPGVLKASYMINVDSEEENAICIGCAGGFTVSMTLPLPREPFSDATHLSLVLNNFCGGHTGADIHLGRANPLHVLGRLLCCSPCAYRLVSVACGTADNAIPRKCVAEVALAPKDVSGFTAAMQKEFGHFQKEYHRIEQKASLEVAATQATQQPTTEKATRQFVGFLETCPYAVQRYSPVEPDAVETSMTCAIASSDAQAVTFVASVRSSSNTQMDMMYNKLRCVCDMAGLALSPKKAPYPGWEPKPDSPLTQALVQAYKQTIGVTPRVYAIHAGLECGLFMEKYPELDCSSIGPELNSPHSPDERLKISSVAPFYRVLLSALENLANSSVCLHPFVCYYQFKDPHARGVSVAFSPIVQSRKVFRFSNLGTALIQSLDRMVQEGQITGAQRESILKQFDKEMCLEFERRVLKLPKAKLTADVSSYKRLYDTWTFSLTNWLLCIDDEQSIMDVQAKFFSMIGVKK